MKRIAAVKTNFCSKIMWFDALDLNILPKDYVIVKTSKGIEYAKVNGKVFEADDKQIKRLNSPLKPVMRIANYRDRQKAENLRNKSVDALPIFKEIAAETNKNMIPVFVDFLFDGKKAIFYFTAPERQDFRDLVSKLVSKFKTKIDMRQISEREKAANIGGIGSCGHELCCTKLGKCPKHVTIKMAKTQGLALNPENISGICGKLLCCLKYEYSNYEKFSKTAPKMKAKVLTPDGIATVVDVNMPNEYVMLAVENDKKRVRISISDMTLDKDFSIKIHGKNSNNNKPNCVPEKAWNASKQDQTEISLESVYTNTNLQDSEKLATGIVTQLPTAKKRRSSSISTLNATNTNKQNKKNSNYKKRRAKKSNKKNSHNKNIYESQGKTTRRRRSTTLSSTTNASNRPGKHSSSLR